MSREANLDVPSREKQGRAATGKILQAVIVSGMSGSGKSSALKAFEDIGYFCIDNLPIILLPELFTVLDHTSSGTEKIALVMDVREPTFLDQFASIFQHLKASGQPLELLFLDAKDDVILQRFSQTRRKHPVDAKISVTEAIKKERRQLRGLRELADRTLDTSDFNVHQLRRAIHEMYAPRERLDRLLIHMISFGFKYGIPAEANIVLDVRFLPNPYFIQDLSSLTGCDKAVQDFVLDNSDTAEFIEHTEALFNFLIPKYKKEGKSYLVIAIGCTGGHHRSVTITEYFTRLLRSQGEDVIVTHRDKDRED